MSTEKPVKITNQAGSLDARVLDQNPQEGMVICHPHPLFGGTMDNKVVTTIARAAKNSGLSTLRFNFRGVGSSDGQHDEGRGEQDDVLAVLKYAQETLGWQKLLLVGFSFGAGMACLAATRQPELLKGLVMVAPAVHHFDAPTTLPLEFDSWVIMGDADEVVPFNEVSDWVQRVVPQPHWLVFKEGSHFFHGRLIDLRDSVIELIEQWQASNGK
ncbi:MAG: alpha/beta fold hydrolase [Oleibacter sp.]|nr:alpha/beta fold hydrolase [Thalassolituus sp.]